MEPPSDGAAGDDMRDSGWGIGMVGDNPANKLVVNVSTAGGGYVGGDGGSSSSGGGPLRIVTARSMQSERGSSEGGDSMAARMPPSEPDASGSSSCGGF